jgi:hypothetical protein
MHNTSPICRRGRFDLHNSRTLAVIGTISVAFILGGCDLSDSAALTPPLQSPTAAFALHTTAKSTASNASSDGTPIPTLSPVVTVTSAGGFVKCQGEGTAGSSVDAYVNCWSGNVNGYRTYIWSGYARDYGGGKGWEPICGSGDVDEYSYYHIIVGKPSGNDLRGGYGCGHLSILGVSGTAIAFKLEDFTGNTYTKTLDFTPLIEDPSSTPAP